MDLPMIHLDTLGYTHIMFASVHETGNAVEEESQDALKFDYPLFLQFCYFSTPQTDLNVLLRLR